MVAYREAMTFNPDARINDSKVSRHRGRTAGFAVGGGGAGIIVLLIVGQLLGVDLSGFAGGSDDTSSDENLSQCTTGQDANESIDCRMAGAALSIDSYWASLPNATGYGSPDFQLFSDSVSTGCGASSSAVGPFYCPTDETIYLDTGFFDALKSRFDASGGPLAQMYVVAHEWGHHIQNISGTMANLDQRDTGPGSDSVRLELQSDCYSGAWAGSASTVPDESGTPFLQPITQPQIADALNAAAAIGDDRIQQQTGGQVDPESWTHGSSEQRQRWFTAGFEGGPGACDTFGVPAASL